MRTTRILALTSTMLLAIGLPLPASASQDSAVIATVRQFIDGFNRSDAKSEVAACDSQASIIDDFAPHEWQGPTACADWTAAYAAEAKKDGIAEGSVTLGKPWYLAVTGNRAYAVFPATFAYKDHGKPVTEGGAVFTVALRKSSMGWRITGWAWSKH